VLQSEIRAMSVACDAVNGINLAQGVCDTGVPEPVATAAKAAIDTGLNIYTRLDGIERLRTAIAKDFSIRHKIAVDAEREVLVTSGATGALYATVMALLNPGDEVILFEPFYGYHVGTLKSLRVVPVAVPLEDATWALDMDALRSAITPKTRALLINTPSNPCGKVFTRSELEEIAALAREHDLFVFTDEIYEHFVYPGHEHVSMATLDGMRERTIVMSGFSKTFSITGWRVGYLIADARWAGSIGYFHDLMFVCAPSPFQHAVATGLEELPASFYRGLASDHEVKREMLVSALRDAGMTPHVPDGAYYILADASSIPGANAAEKARALLKRTGVAAVAGSAFFRAGHGENLLRFCFAKKDEDLRKACEWLRKR
jgi:aminotransferase